jgi:hypothetical protein
MRTQRRLRAVITTAMVVAVMACASPRESRIASPSAPTIVDISNSARSTDAGLTSPACKTAFMHGSFCEELRELWRVVQSESAMRRCLAGTTEAATSALQGIVMVCQTHRPWGPDCAGNPPGQSDYIVECRLVINYAYGDKNHDLTPYVQRAAAAVAACDPAYHASPIRDIGVRDKAIGLSHPLEPGSSLQKVVSVCSQCGDLPPDEAPENLPPGASDPPEFVPVHYDVVIELYGVAPDAGAPAPR